MVTVLCCLVIQVKRAEFPAAFWDNGGMDSISLPQLEQAINYWRGLQPSQGEESRLCPQAAALAVPYALMIFGRRHDIDTGELPADALRAYRDWQRAVAGQQPADSE